MDLYCDTLLQTTTLLTQVRSRTLQKNTVQILLFPLVQQLFMISGLLSYPFSFIVTFAMLFQMTNSRNF
jgi:hypothetical protein